jgi:multidrug resistance efflux pump
MKSRSGIIKLTLLVAVLLCATVIVGSLLYRGTAGNQAVVGSDAITFEVFQGEFISSVNEVGDIESSSNVEIRCKVKSRGRTGVAILELIPEGTKVKEGDFLCQLDDSLLREELTERKVAVAKDKADVIQATSMLDAAKRKLKEYEEGTYNQELAKLKAAINVAQEREKRAIEVYGYSATLSRKGYITNTQLKADEFAAKTAKEELNLAEEELRVYKEYTKDRMVAELSSDIEQQAARLEASEFTLELSQQREAEYARQVASCRIVAPQAGTLVYANDSDRRDSSIVIEEGATIRDGQEIFYLPDPSKMQVNAKVNDSKINKVKKDQRVEIRVDTAPETPIAGVVRRVSSFPLPRRYYQAPIEYEVFVDITEQSPLIRGGLRGKVEIFVERQEEVVQAPVSSLLVGGPEYYFVIVKTETGIEPRHVEIGSNNDKFVVIKSGLEPGDVVLVDADNYRDAVEIPTAS